MPQLIPRYTIEHTQDLCVHGHLRAKSTACLTFLDTPFLFQLIRLAAMVPKIVVDSTTARSCGTRTEQSMWLET